MSIPKLIWLIARYRSWREWQIYDTEANAIDLYQGWVLKEREGGMAGHHLQQHSRWPADDDRCYGGLSHPSRVRTHRSAYNLLLSQVIRQMRRAYANVHNRRPISQSSCKKRTFGRTNRSPSNIYELLGTCGRILESKRRLREATNSHYMII